MVLQVLSPEVVAGDERRARAPSMYSPIGVSEWWRRNHHSPKAVERSDEEKQMLIIGVSGKRGAGKTTLAEFLVKKHKFKRISFAEELRNIAQVLFPLKEEDLSNIKRKEAKFRHYDWSPRDFMINLGGFLRFHDKSYFLNAALAKCESGGLYVIDDVRYINEADAIRAMGGILIRLNRYEAQNPYGKNLDVESETELDNYKFDYVIHEANNQKLSDLYNASDDIFETYVK